MEIDARKWTIIVLCLMFIWGSLWLLFYLKADEVTKDPCSICSKKMGSQVVCTTIQQGVVNRERIYYPNGTVYEPKIQFRDDYQPKELNFTFINEDG